jgi:hypothetical protein
MSKYTREQIKEIERSHYSDILQGIVKNEQLALYDDGEGELDEDHDHCHNLMSSSGWITT